MPFGISLELVALFFFFGGFAVVLVSVETFIEASAETALEFGVSVFFLTAVFAGADVENAIIGLAAVYQGLPGLAIGTVFGEAVFVLTVHTPFFIASLLLAVSIFWRGNVGRADGVALVGLYIAYWPASSCYEIRRMYNNGLSYLPSCAIE